MGDINTDTIEAGDFLILGFGNGTQGVKVIGTTAKRLEIVRCQGYQSERPFWTGAISKLSRTDPRIMRAWAVPQHLAAAAPSAADIAETKVIAKHKAACSKFANATAKPIEAEADAYVVKVDFYNLTGAEQRKHLPTLNEMRERSWAARQAAQAEWCAKHSRDQYGRVIDATR